MFSKNYNYSLIAFILLMFLSMFFLLSVTVEFYPDSLFLKSSLLNKNENELYITPQNIVFTIFKYLNIKISYLKHYFLIVFFIINILFLLFVIFLNNFINSINNKKKYNANNYLLLISLSFPTVLLSITAPSAESLFSILVIFVMFEIMERKFNKLKLIFLSIILIYCYFLDKGNWLVFLVFIFYIYTLKAINNKTNLYITIILSSSILIIAGFLGEHIILLLAEIFNLPKGFAMVNNIKKLGLDERELLDIFIRYIYFWSTLFNFINHFKDITFFILPVIVILIFITSINLYKRWNYLKVFFTNQFVVILIYAILTYPFFIIYILPTHAFGKYYLFIVPILLKFLSIILKPNKLIFYMSLISLLSTLNILFLKM